ncbi:MULTISPECIES: peptidoglycan DD-metalloendopeptidase family protein [Rhodococcus]|uniref:peptidoglycan DD-metalloendopeptidase family protein n=1 Tax=Rhodococcus TaxID=1827 RepID=UPI002955DA7C|nr:MULTISPECIES: peptidoglycan DD-metalloendopeptidase family protein [Rhodococcus]MDV7244470.1 peptidoglycan DD-metalloendopeptidase family protein [Rhodococcus oxybenzonivorans]MDV7274287.1 peptidoglycan DD-metalloendopeptidase family protein [Rhodococcus oxybenzonivorans]MDV7337827.1 peptidoglycan DD-metalloendopeptidase family protein [Rhodococcus oxybenzonivorans]MDV7345237.1 peptidoglycan DD-metalloendopeptidase family protein [Rhodococcus oxybenzonivorans]MDV8028925.1 peptidoglycan DD-m
MARRVSPVAADFYVTSGFGNRAGGFHWGTDFGRNGGSGGHPVFAAQGGSVVMVGPASGFGEWVVLDHPTADGSGTTVYGHVIPEVRQGQRVEAGQRIARINPDSNTNGGVAPHLHFEVHRYIWVQPGPDRLDPVLWLASSAPPATGGTPVGQLQADVTLLSPNDSGPRNPANCTLAIVHTDEGDPNGKVEDLLGWLAQERAQASYTLVVGRDGRIGRSNDDNYVPWAAGSPANERGLHLCFKGRASQTRAEWLAQGRQLDAGARVLRDWHDRYGIPLVKLSGAQMRAGQKGVGGHADTVDAWHSTDHTDPGPGFPWDVLLAKAAGNTTPEEGFLMALSDAEQRRIYTELTQKLPSRSKYRTNDEPVDTLAGMVLNIDARIHEESTEREALNGVKAAIDLVRREAARGDAGAKAVLARIEGGK